MTAKSKSEFWIAYNIILREGENFPPFDKLASAFGKIKEDLELLLEETQNKYDNVPENLKSGPTGELLEERITGLEYTIANLDFIDLEYIVSEKKEDESPEDYTLREKIEREERSIEIWREVISALEELDCG